MPPVIMKIVKSFLEHRIYADKVFAIASGEPEVVLQNLNNLDNKLHKWAESRGAAIPAVKAKLPHVCRKRDCNGRSMRIKDADVNVMEEMRILGVIFTRKLL